ncbi:MAG TPA: ABC transporter permease [Gaiellaceae bacterium]|jgi:peptide/nickel transport system permease protein|nr:ABC transporter permease [Gaiellaceae bacterium]
MGAFLVRRLFWAIFLLLAATIVTYVIFFLVPGDPAQLACGRACTPQDVARVRHLLFLDRPIYVQYGHFLWNLVGHQSLGTSFANRQPVNYYIGQEVPVTASLVFGGAVFWLAISIPIGVLSALKPKSLLDRAGMVFVLIGISAHPVWIGLILSFVFGYKLGVTPISGYCNFFGAGAADNCGGPVQWAYHLLLPWCTFMLLFAALYVRLIRANVMETMNEDYVRTARAKGSPERRVLLHHILRNSMLPVVTILGMDIGLALGGAIFTESIFNLHGLGQQLVQSANQLDLPVIMGIVIFSTIAVITFNLLVDIAYAFLDPRIRLS